MSRSYDMQIRVYGVKEENFESVVNFLEEVWWRGDVAEIKDIFENNRDDITKPDGISFFMCEQGILCGGEGEDEFAEKVYIGLTEIEPDIRVKIHAVYLDDPPSTEYSFGFKEKKAIIKETFLNEVKRFVENMEIYEQMDDDEIESLMEMVKFYLELKNGNISKEEVETSVSMFSSNTEN